jgi:hypothetical protein
MEIFLILRTTGEKNEKSEILNSIGFFVKESEAQKKCQDLQKTAALHGFRQKYGYKSFYLHENLLEPVKWVD